MKVMGGRKTSDFYFFAKRFFNSSVKKYKVGANHFDAICLSARRRRQDDDHLRYNLQEYCPYRNLHG